MGQVAFAMRYARSLHSNVIVAERRDITLSADRLAYDVLAIPIIYLLFSPLVFPPSPPAHGHSRLFARTSFFALLARDIETRLETRRVGIVHALLSNGECLRMGAAAADATREGVASNGD